MAPLAWIFMLVYVIALSYLIHEWSHVIAAKMVGWERRGWYFKLPWAIGVQFDQQGRHRDMWIVALWGLAATSLLCVTGLLVGGILGAWLAAVNGAILFVNCLPLKGTDGWHVMQGMRHVL